MFFRQSKNSIVESSAISSLADEDIILAFKATADNKCIETLFTRYTHLVFGVCMKYLRNEDDAKDAVMEIFEDLTDLLLRHEIKNFKSWLYAVSRNFCLMRQRKRSAEDKHKTGMIKNHEEAIVEFPEPEHLIQEEEQNFNHLKEALSQLNEEQKKCIELMYLNDKSYKEISDITGYQLNEVKSHIQNGKRNLKIKFRVGNT